MKYEDFDARLGMFLQDVAMGTTADLTDRAIAYWDGQRVVYACLRDGSDDIKNEFNPGDHWNQWREQFTRWIEAPVFSVRPEVHEWTKEAPPYGAER